MLLEVKKCIDFNKEFDSIDRREFKVWPCKHNLLKKLLYQYGENLHRNCKGESLQLIVSMTMI